jgi:hypothetical protein
MRAGGLVLKAMLREVTGFLKGIPRTLWQIAFDANFRLTNRT